MSEKPSIFYEPFFIESPEGKKIKVNPVASYPPDEKGHYASLEAFYGQIVDIAADLDECGLFIDSCFKPSEFLRGLKEKGYKVYFKEKA